MHETSYSFLSHHKISPFPKFFCPSDRTKRKKSMNCKEEQKKSEEKKRTFRSVTLASSPYPHLNMEVLRVIESQSFLMKFVTVLLLH